MPKDDAMVLTASANLIYTYQACIKGVDAAPLPECINSGMVKVGDAIWVKATPMGDAQHD